jgi:predicted  nucleic acid-binding Zn-ribbon protein
LKEKAMMEIVMTEMDSFDTPHTINELRDKTALGIYSWEQLVVLFRKMEERNLLYKFTYEKKNYYILAVKTNKKIHEEAVNLAEEGKYAEAIQMLKEIIGEYEDAVSLKVVLEEINQKAMGIKNKYQPNIDSLNDKISKHKADITGMEDQLSKLGFFAGKEKKRLSAEIEEIDTIISSLQDEMKEIKESMEAEIMSIPERDKIKQL